MPNAPTDGQGGRTHGSKVGRRLTGTLLGLALAVGLASTADADEQVVLGMNTTGITENTDQALSNFTSRAGVTPGISMYYQDWNEGWSSALLNPRFTVPISEDGSVPMVTWSPMLDTRDPIHQPKYAPSRIASGTFDRYIHRAAREAAAYGRPFFLRLAHEMNGSWSPWGAHVGHNRPGDYVAMWRHVVSIFDREGASNVRWVWSPNVDVTKNVEPFKPFYPGDRWVDLVALDGYNWGTTNHARWRSFNATFASSYRAVRALTGKPMMIGETASTEHGGNKAEWIDRIGPSLESMPAVKALVWFDRRKETDWRIDSSPASKQAFRSMATSSLFSGDVRELVAASTRGDFSNLHPAGSPVVRAQSRRVSEGNRGHRTTRIHLTLSHRPDAPVAVSYRLAGQRRAAGRVRSRSGVIHFGMKSRASLRIRLHSDRRRARNGKARVTLSQPKNARLGKRRAVLRIRDDD